MCCVLLHLNEKDGSWRLETLPCLGLDAYTFEYIIKSLACVAVFQENRRKEKHAAVQKKKDARRLEQEQRYVVFLFE